MSTHGPSRGGLSSAPRLRLLLALLVVAVSAGGTLAGLAVYAKWRDYRALQAELALARSQLDLQAARQLELARELGTRIAALEEELAARDAQLTAERRTRSTLEQELGDAERELASLRRRHEAALADLAAMAEGAAASQARLARLGAERRQLETRLTALEGRLARALGERDVARRNEEGLRWRVELLEKKLAEATSSRQLADAWLRDWMARQVDAVEAVLASAGVDPVTLFERAGEEIAAGQGGPLEPAEDGGEPQLGRDVGFTLDEPLVRLRAAQELIARLPLGPPLDEFRITSGYGKRRDPLTGKLAIHRGIDFGAPRNAEVVAPAPGRVLRAGRDGAYGLLVEIDHGMGIVTRYAHLKKLLVAAGDRVDFRQPIGIVGSSGRSTGRHLHYEIRVAGRPIDPAGFLEAGRTLVDVFKD